ncbi:hypothetical protein BP00DRAFT_21740 [Aspergillus indologenus CBS 114.80]|uniref:Uncharacterized protein n=1 Tax=Aspergillus indologenus CBS 114.80 TaxID=1450541 RepID=A0A2V5HUD2_9EURO|nr:hypothetical protein BP00DRAFT_21740 [Aspergillus indologenus CBS 114.80]
MYHGGVQSKALLGMHPHALLTCRLSSSASSTTSSSVLQISPALSLTSPSQHPLPEILTHACVPYISIQSRRGPYLPYCTKGRISDAARDGFGSCTHQSS